MANYDLIVIGAGPAGYEAAIRAAQLGKKVACVDKDRYGGTCNNWGCIPTKALLKNAELYHDMKDRAAEFGFAFTGLDFDWSKIVKRSRDISEKGSAGVNFLFKKNKIDPLRGEASLDKPGEVKVRTADGKQEAHSAKNILIATGCVSRPLPGLPFNGKTVIGSKEAVALERLPKSIVIIGAGAIGIEFAYIFNSFGTKVTVVEMLPNILPIEDTEVSQALEKSFTKQGVQLLTNHKTTKTEANEQGVKITVADSKGSEKTLEAELALVAIGVSPVLPGGSVKVGLDEKGFIKVNDRYETTARGIYAAGDIIGPPWLAHVASFEAIQTVEGLFVPGYKPKKVTVFPGCTYLPSASCQCWAYGTRCERQRPPFQDRQNALHRQRQGPRHRRKRRIRQSHRRRTSRRNPWRAYHRAGCHRDDRRAGTRHCLGANLRRDFRYDSCSSHP